MANAYGTSSGQAGGLQSGARRAQTWAHFLRLLQARGGLARDLAERAAASVMCVLELRLVGDEDEAEASLPYRLRELLQTCPRHEEGDGAPFGKPEFVTRVADDLGVEYDESEYLVRAVFETVREWLTEGEVDDVSCQLPADLRELWAQAG
jgi:uncharacterized protein (DUF2267 family)